MIDYPAAEREFREYLQTYDNSDDKIQLKIVHTFGVVRAAENLAEELGFSKEDRELARIIALLHDIGRFEQLRIYHTFDDRVMPHARCSVDLLFEQGMIRRFLADSSYDSVIQTAIANHGTYRLAEGLEGRTLLHARLIRDADKLDNYRVKLKDSIPAMLDISAKELGLEAISDQVYHTFLQGIPILNEERITHMDMWVSYLGYLFDLNEPASFRYLERIDAINQMIDRISYRNTETADRMEQIRQKANSYIHSRSIQ